MKTIDDLENDAFLSFYKTSEKGKTMTTPNSRQLAERLAVRICDAFGTTYFSVGFLGSKHWSDVTQMIEEELHLEELMRDRERLNFIESSKRSLNWDDNDIWCCWNGSPSKSHYAEQNIRKAIDQAIDAARGGEG